MFIDPTDGLPAFYPERYECERAARRRIGLESIDKETITQVEVFRVESVSVQSRSKL